MKSFFRTLVIALAVISLNGAFIYKAVGDDKSEAKKAYTDYITAVAEENLETVKKCVTAGLRHELETDDSKQKLLELKKKTPSQVDIFGISVFQSKASLMVDGTFNGRSVSGTVYMVLEDGEWKFSGQKFDEEFDFTPPPAPPKPVQPPVPQPDKKDTKPESKPSSDEDALKILYDNFRKAMKSGDFKELKKYLSADAIKEMEQLGDPQELMSMAIGFMPTETTVTDVAISGDEGTLSFEGKMGDQEGEGSVDFVREGGAWKIKKHSFNVGAKSRQKPVAELAGLPGKIAFISNREGQYEVYVMNPDGSKCKPVTKTGGFKDFVAWSPDGMKLVFDSHPISEATELYTVNIDGRGLSRLTKNDAEDRAPVWSPDGRWIAFSSSSVESKTENSRSYNPPDIWVVRPDGSGLKQLTSGKGGAENISWSSGSDRLVYRSSRDNSFRIFSIDIDGGDEKQLTDSDGWDDFPVCSPKDDSILFLSSKIGEGVKVFSMDSEGTNKTQLDVKILDRKPLIWSPDGSLVIVQCSPHGHFTNDICIMKADGSEFKNLTDSKDEELSPSWSPDGKWIAFRKTYNIYVIEVESGKIYQATNGGDIGEQVIWSPK
ncbi:MAG: PD40 domain-containing protein [Planctomycetes bacterium]|nr:PD40 domain-containing protein [Planctomycetota bacterium]